MKKLIIFLFLISTLFYTHSFNNSFCIKNYFTGEYTAYSSSSNTKDINLGFCSITNTKTKSTIGESIICQNLELSAAIKTLKATVLKKEYLDCNTVVIYGYSPLINKSVNLNNLKVNIQIAVKDNEIIIGWPLILGSF